MVDSTNYLTVGRVMTLGHLLQQPVMVLPTPKNVGFQYRGNGLSISHDLTCIEDKIEAVRQSIKWRLDFVDNKYPDNKEDQEINRTNQTRCPQI